jgi:hypothetical protein
MDLHCACAVYIGRIFTLLTGSTALRFTATGVPLGARRIQILADESACLKTDNVRNELVTIHRSQEMLKMMSLYT